MPKKILALEGLRGFAALLVFGVHFNALFGKNAGDLMGKILAFESAVGSTGVEIFFFLSGFLIYGMLMKKNQRPFHAFLLGRARRIYPTFGVVFGLYLGISVVFPEYSKIPERGGVLYIMENLFMMPGLFPVVPLITVAWSLSYEWAFYLSLPVLIGIFRLRNKTKSFCFVVWGSIVVLLFMTGQKEFVFFVGGILLWEMTSRKTSGEGLRLSATTENISMVVFLAVLGCLGTGHLPSFLHTFVMCGAIFPVVLHAVEHDGKLKRIFSWGPLCQVGTISYSFYLTHGLVLHALRALTPNIRGPYQTGAMLLVSIASSIAFGGIIFLAVEKPLSFSTKGRKQKPAMMGTSIIVPVVQQQNNSALTEM